MESSSNSMNHDQMMMMMYSSSDEQEAVDQVAVVAGEEEEQEQQQHSFGVGRSYECVFCRRGFNTAQALGGHMNIHRKDRARNNFNNKPTMISTADDLKKKQEENYYCYYYYLCQQQQIPSCSVHLPTPDLDHQEEEAVQLRYRNFKNNNCQELPSVSSSSSGAGFFYGNHHSQLFGEENINGGRRGGELMMNMSLRPPFGSSTGFSGEIRQEELDLELRL